MSLRPTIKSLCKKFLPAAEATLPIEVHRDRIPSFAIVPLRRGRVSPSPDEMSVAVDLGSLW